MNARNPRPDEAAPRLRRRRSPPEAIQTSEHRATAEQGGASAGASLQTVREPRAAGSRIGFLVHDVSRMRSTLYDQAVRPLNLTRSQWWVLGQLSRQRTPKGVPQTELARLLEVGKVTIGGLVDRLEERGFVERRPDPEDRRAKRVVVTPAGREVLKQMVRLSEELNATIFAGFSEDEMRMVESVLARMKGNIREALDGRGTLAEDGRAE